jgi:hypothetical protein
MSCSVKIDKNAYIVPNNPRLDLSVNNFNGFASLSLTTFDIGVNITGNIRLMPNNTERIRITNGGNVGINNTNPNYLLDIGGNANFTGSITANNFIGNVITAGYSWNLIQPNDSTKVWCIAYGNGIFVACFESSQLKYSYDGINWINGFAAGGYTRGIQICFGNGIFIILTLYYSGQTANYYFLFVSADAINYRTINLGTLTNNMTNLCYGNNTFVIVCNGGTNRVLTSKDGVNWSASVSNVTSGSTFDSSWNSVCYGNGQFVAVANAGNSANTTKRSMTSTDGYTWTIKTTPADNSWNSVCYANGLFVAVGASGSQRVMTTNGTSTNSWTLVSTGETTETWKSICYGNGQFVAVADTGNYRIMTSINTTNWTLLNYSSYTLYSICYGNGIYVSGLSSYFLVSGKQTQNLAISNTSNMSYTSLYADKSITLYDNTGIARTNSGLQYKSLTVSHMWSLVKNISNSSLSFSSLYGYQFYANGTSSTNGTFALGISTTGNIQIGSTMSFNYGAPTFYVNGTVCINGSVNIKNANASAMTLNIGTYFIDPTNYGLIQFAHATGFTDRSFFSFVRYSTGDYWQLGMIYNNTQGMAFYGSGGRFQNSASIPCFTMLNSSAGINQTPPGSSFSYNLDVNGSGRFTQNLQTGNLTCSKITVSNVKTWYMTSIPGQTVTTYTNGYIGGSSYYQYGFGNVFLNGSTTETFGTLPYWNKDYATFTAPTTGLYMFNLHIFDTTANMTDKGNCLQICGNGLPQTQPNGGQYLTFGQSYNSAEGAYVITQTLLLTSGQIIFFKNSGSVDLNFYYGKGCTELTITQLC